MMRKFHEAKIAGHPSVELWGTGTPKRELLFVEDLADALVFVMNHFEASRDREDEKMFLNIGTGVDVSIRELAHLVQKTVGYEGDIIWNDTMPDGTPRKLMDVSRLTALGWKAQTSLEDGLSKTYAWFLDNQGTLRR
jgi:GDP-L-fucose synthase